MDLDPYRVTPPRPLEVKDVKKDLKRQRKRSALYSGIVASAILLADLFALAQAADRHIITASHTCGLVVFIDVIFCFFCFCWAWAAFDTWLKS